jgi:hypothetical protein
MWNVYVKVYHVATRNMYFAVADVSNQFSPKLPNGGVRKCSIVNTVHASHLFISFRVQVNRNEVMYMSCLVKIEKFVTILH